MFIKIKEFIFFYDQALRSDHTFHKVRKNLWDIFLTCYSTFEVDNCVALRPNTFAQLKGYLCAKNDHLNDDKRLAFESSLQELYSVVGNELKVSSSRKNRKLITIHANELSVPLNPELDDGSPEGKEEVSDFGK